MPFRHTRCVCDNQSKNSPVRGCYIYLKSLQRTCKGFSLFSERREPLPKREWGTVGGGGVPRPRKEKRPLNLIKGIYCEIYEETL